MRLVPAPSQPFRPAARPWSYRVAVASTAPTTRCTMLTSRIFTACPAAITDGDFLCCTPGHIRAHACLIGVDDFRMVDAHRPCAAGGNARMRQSGGTSRTPRNAPTECPRHPAERLEPPRARDRHYSHPCRGAGASASDHSMEVVCRDSDAQ